MQNYIKEMKKRFAQISKLESALCAELELYKAHACGVLEEVSILSNASLEIDEMRTRVLQVHRDAPVSSFDKLIHLCTLRIRDLFFKLDTIVECCSTVGLRYDALKRYKELENLAFHYKEKSDTNVHLIKDLTSQEVAEGVSQYGLTLLSHFLGSGSVSDIRVDRDLISKLVGYAGTIDTPPQSSRVDADSYSTIINTIDHIMAKLSPEGYKSNNKGVLSYLGISKPETDVADKSYDILQILRDACANLGKAAVKLPDQTEVIKKSPLPTTLEGMAAHLESLFGKAEV